MSCFVFEIGFEEMPSRFLAGIVEQLSQHFRAALAEAELGHGEVACHATPRRVALLVHDLAAAQPLREETFMGPPVKVALDGAGAPTKAGLGFAKSQQVEFDQCMVVPTDKGDYLAVQKTVGGKTTLEVLPAICAAALESIHFPKKMRWGSADFTFGRPVRWLLALLDDQVVPCEAAGLVAGRQTRGHRVHGMGPWDVPTAADYLRVLAEQGKVVLESERRKAIVRQEGDALAAAAHGRIVWRERLMDEVAGLVEHPKAMLGNFDPAFLQLPRDVLLTSMEAHQKSFGVENDRGELLPHFLCVLNLEPTGLERVRAGWERVLKARLSDAMFFWNTDLNCSLELWAEKLEKVTFLKGLGSMADKCRRVEALCGFIAEQVDPSLKPVATTAARFAKADLVSEMVGEFAELQGVMGGIYAAQFGEEAAVCQAIAEQYLPAGPETPVPASLAGAILALADRMDTLAGCFALGKIPTGAQDPFALRRAALGVCRICIEHSLRLPLGELAAQALQCYTEQAWKREPAEILQDLMDFLRERLKQMLMGQGADTLVVEAALGAGYDDLRSLKDRVDALQAFRQEPDFGQAVLTFKRAANIIAKSGAVDAAFDPALLQQEEEKALAQAMQDVAPRFDVLWDADDYPALLGLLRELRPAVDAFFDHVMVNVEDAALRANRLALLAALVGMLGRVADFGALQV
ncbi:MAG: glycine--tRNA ligase subunit beta [Desulfovibrio sp.]|nr:glycine--tRNA ligase subunit beta [Desulfovibrio sp.]MCA1985434.1 glycine--tRNA ligase subunit beta [Desulfovibrio sp.]